MTYDAYTRYIYATWLMEELLRADATQDPRPKIYLESARGSLCQLLSGCQAGTGTETARDMLLTLIEDAISDSFDVDWKAEHGAEAVVNALLDTVAPLSVEKQEDAA